MNERAVDEQKKRDEKVGIVPMTNRLFQQCLFQFLSFHRDNLLRLKFIPPVTDNDLRLLIKPGKGVLNVAEAVTEKAKFHWKAI